MASPIVGFSTLITAFALALAPEPKLIFTDLPHKNADQLNVMAATSKGQTKVGQLSVLPGMEPYSKLSPDGRYAFFARHTLPNHDEMSAELYRMDLMDGRLELLTITSDAAPPLPLGGPDVAWTSTLAIHPIDEERAALGELFTVDVAIYGAIGGEQVQLCQLDDIYGAHFAGITEGGIVLYVVRRQEAAFYLLPLEKSLADKLNGPIRGVDSLVKRGFAKDEIESKSPKIAPSGIVRLAKAPEGPFARDFVVSGQTLLFGSGVQSVQNRTLDGENALYALDVTAPESLWTGKKGGEVNRSAIRLENTGNIHPNPVIVSENGQFFFSRTDELSGTGPRNLISAVQLSKNEQFARPDGNTLAQMALEMNALKAMWQNKGAHSMKAASEEITLDQEARPSIHRRELMRIRGRGRIVAASQNGSKLALERRFEGDSLNEFGQRDMKVELLWVDQDAKQTVQIQTSDIHEVLGFSEVLQ